MIKKKDNKVIKKIDNLRNNLNIKEQSKDLYNNLGILEGSIGFISDLNLNIDRLKKPFIVFKPFNLKMKISKNVFYIVMKNNIYIYLKNL